MPRLRNANACRRAVDQAVVWLREHIAADEASTGLAYPLKACHKVPYLMATTGQVEECQQLLTRIKANLLTRDGDLLSSAVQETEGPQPANLQASAWVAVAAHISGRFDVAPPVAQALARRQGGTFGGVYDCAGEDEASPSADLRTTACVGLAFLTCGMLRRARDAGLFLVRAMQDQSDAKRFHVRFDTRCRVVRKFPKEKAFFHVLGRGPGRADFNHLAMPTVFLGRLHLATGEAEWLEAALDYFTVAEEFGEIIWSAEGSSALGWAAAMLYGITRKRTYYDAAERFAQVRIDRQRKDGSWQRKGAPTGDASTLALTAESAVGLLESLREAQ